MGHFLSHPSYRVPTKLLIRSTLYHVQVCTTYGLLELFLRPARAFSIAENVAKARLRINNCRSGIFFKLQRNERLLRPLANLYR